MGRAFLYRTESDPPVVEPEATFAQAADQFTEGLKEILSNCAHAHKQAPAAASAPIPTQGNGSHSQSDETAGASASAAPAAPQPVAPAREATRALGEILLYELLPGRAVRETIPRTKPFLFSIDQCGKAIRDNAKIVVYKLTRKNVRHNSMRDFLSHRPGWKGRTGSSNVSQRTFQVIGCEPVQAKLSGKQRPTSPNAFRIECLFGKFEDSSGIFTPFVSPTKRKSKFVFVPQVARTAEGSMQESQKTFALLKAHYDAWEAEKSR